MDWEKSCINLHHFDGSIFQSFSEEQLAGAVDYLVDIMSEVIEMRKLTLLTRIVCSRPWLHDKETGNVSRILLFNDWTPYHLRSFLALLSIAMLEGNDVIAQFPNNYDFVLTLLIASYAGMTILAIMNAKVTAGSKADILPVVQVLKRKEALEDTMTRRLVDQNLMQSILRFWCLSNFEYNKINFDADGELLKSLSRSQSLKLKDVHARVESLHLYHRNGKNDQ